MACSCGTNCGGKCSSCASNNNFGWGSCSCGDDCSGSCFAACRNNCTGSCSGSCTGSCTNGCKDDCGSGCNTGCESSAAIDLYNTLAAGLNEKIFTSDFVNINQMLLNEAARRSATITSVTFTSGNPITSADISQLQANTVTIGFPAEGDTSKGAPISSTTHNNILESALNAYEDTITSSSTG